MILTRIEFKNFRCFKGQCHFDISTDPDRNVTLIHAQNGVGKTNILNAVLWAMHGKTTPRFEQKQKIIHDEAEQEGATEAWVQLEFEHQDEEYLVRRTYFKDKFGKYSEIVKTFTVKGGNHDELKNPEGFLNSVIPVDMAEYFFFDGEHAETFTGEKNSKKVGDAIRDVLGFELADNAKEDVKNAIKEYVRRAAAAQGGTGSLDLSHRKESLEDQVEKAKDLLSDADNQRKHIEIQIDDLGKALKGSEVAKEIEEQRERNEKNLVGAVSRRKHAESEIIKWLSENALLLASGKISSQTFDFINSEELEGRFPSPYYESFIRELLEKEKCICARELCKGDEHWNAVFKMQEKAGNPELLSVMSKIKGRAASLERSRENLHEKLETKKAVLKTSIAEINDFEQERDRLKTKLKGIKIDDIREKEEAREKLQDQLKQKEREITRFEVEIENTEKTIQQLEKDIEEATKKNLIAQSYFKKKDFSQSILNLLETMLEDDADQARKVIQKKINDILERATRKHFRVQIDTNFAIKLLSDGVALPKSGGENQLLSLAFTTALIYFAKLRKNAQHPYLLPGTIAPLVLDSPFGQLDDFYRKETATFVPAFAQQVILLVSRSQGDNDLIDALAPHIGAEYVLVRENKGAKGDKPEDAIDLRGKEYTRTRYGCQSNRTIIEEVYSYEEAA